MSYERLRRSKASLWSANTTAGHLSIPGRWQAAQTCEQASAAGPRMAVHMLLSLESLAREW